MALAHHEILSQILIKRLIPPVTSSGTVNTYNTTQGGSSIDTWTDGVSTTKFQWQKGVIIINAATVTTSIVPTLRDDDAALTNSNGDANSTLALTLETITSAGLYIAEFSFGHVFGATTTRVGVAAANARINRHISLRCVCTGSCIFSATLILGGNLGGFPAYTAATLLTPTYATT